MNSNATPLRSYLIAAILLASVPLALLMAFQLLAAERAQRALMDRQLQRLASTLASSVERELQASVDALSILSHALPAPQDGVDRLATTLQDTGLRRPAWRSLYLLDAQGVPLVGGNVVAGLPRATASADGPRLTSATGAPALGDAIAIDVPLPMPAGAPLRLGALMGPEPWQQLVNGVSPPNGGFVAVLDAQGGVLARNDQAGGNGNGPLRLDGPTIHADWRPVGPGGWRVGVGVDTAVSNAAQQRALVMALATSIGCLLLGAGAAMLLARRVTQPLHLLATHGALAPLGAIAVREVGCLHAALVTAHQRQEQALERLQRKADEFETLFSSSPIGLVFAQGAQPDETVCNAALTALMAPGSDGTPAEVVRNGSPVPPAEQPLQMALATGQPVGPVELELRAAGRDSAHVLVTAAPLRGADGQARAAIGAVVDITERKRSLALQLETTRRLQDSQRLMDLAQEAGHAGFIEHRFDGDRMLWTAGHARLFGLPAAPFEGQLADWLDRIDSDDRERVRQELDDALRSGQTQVLLAYCVVDETARADASPAHHARWLSTRLLISHGDGGRPLRMIGVTVDSSEQRRAERDRDELIERLRTAHDDAQSANHAKDQFLAMLGHELRNPLSAITAAVEVLERVAPDAAVAGNARAIVARQTHKLALLLDDLLDIARLLSGRVVLARQRVDLAALVQRFVQSLRQAGLADAHRLTLQLVPVWIDADAARIEQIVNGLMSNALKYTPAGSDIGVRVAPDGDRALLEVTDSGGGIAPELLGRVFDLFVQGERPLDRSAGGLGVGLTLVRRLTELHDGTVDVQSAPTGSRFSVRLPAVAPPDAPPPAAGANAAPHAPPVPPRRVVLIEDNADALDALRSKLELDGHQVATAVDGPSGLALLLSERPEVAIVDIGLPGLDGYEVAKRSRGGGFAGRLLAVSGYGQPRDVQQAMKAGFDAHLVKPIDMDWLDDELRRA